MKEYTMRPTWLRLTIGLPLLITFLFLCSLHSIAQKRLYVHRQGGAVDTLRMQAGSTIEHSRIDQNGVSQSDYVTLQVTNDDGTRSYLLSDLDSLVLPTGRTVVFHGYTSNVNGNGTTNYTNNTNFVNGTPQAEGDTSLFAPHSSFPKRTSFSGSFPGGDKVTYYWTENDHIRLDVGSESRAKHLSQSNTKAEFVFEDADFEAEGYTVYYPDMQVTIQSHQTQTGANNTEHLGVSGDCGVSVAERQDDGSYSFALNHKASYLCFLPHIAHLPSAKLTRIEVYCEKPIAGRYSLSEEGLYSGSNTSNTIALDLVPQEESDFFIGHDIHTEQDSIAAFMVIAPQDAARSFTVTYYVTDTLSRMSKVYRQNLSFCPLANTVHPITFNISDKEFHTINLGLSCCWSHVNVGADDPSKKGPAYATEADANAALLQQTVVTQWLMPDEDQREELIERCTWTRGVYNGAAGYLVEGASVSKEYHERLRIFIPCEEGKTPAECLASNYRPVEALMIDLGLTSGTKWAARNIGANSVEDYGSYFAWGETAPKQNYTAATYKFTTTQNLGFGYNIGGSELDAAHAAWGGLWRMPTKAELTELNTECAWNLTTLNGVPGFIITGKGENPQKIFLPSAGFMDGTSLIYPGSESNASYRAGSYWSSEQGGTSSEYAWTISWRSGWYNGTRFIYNNSNDYYPLDGNRSSQRYFGRTIRAVAKPSMVIDGMALDISTDSTNWKFNHSTVTLYGTLSSSTPVTEVVTVGFLVGDSATIVKGQERLDQSETTTSFGSFHQIIPVHDNMGYWYRAYIKVGDNYTYAPAKHYGLEMVDLGLPSRTLWANMNVGANSPGEYGNYYAWGETTTKSNYSSATYRTLTTLNYGTNYDIAGSEKDAAHVNWGNAWQMPNKAQWEELNNATYCTWVFSSEDNQTGFRVTSKVNGNSIFLPSAGFMDGTSLVYPGSESNVSYRAGSYWSSEQGGTSSEYAWTISWRSGWYSGTRYIYNNGNDYYPLDGNRSSHRCFGRTIRPVAIPNVMTADSVLNVLTDSASWKFGQTVATLHATLSSTTSLNSSMTVGFITGNSKSIKHGGDGVTDYPQTTDEVGTFSQVVGLSGNLGRWYRAYVKVGAKYYYGSAKHYGLEMVDLGLPSGTQWANMNVGASNPSDGGKYYAWGETEDKDFYSSSNYLGGSGNTRTNFPEGLNIAGTEHDAATEHWGSQWQMPTSSQWDELNNSSYCTWTYSSENNQMGFRITSKVNGNSIFLPFAGYKIGSDLICPGSESNVYYRTGSYWSSEQGGTSSEYAWTISWRTGWYSGTRYIYNNGNNYYPLDGNNSSQRYWGRTIRPVVLQGAYIDGDMTLSVTTDAAEWTTGTSEATIKGTLSSNAPLTGDVTVGFLTMDRPNRDKATVKAYHDLVVSETGEFSMPVAITSVEGVYYVAYIKDGNNYYYSKARFVGDREMVDLGLPSGKLWAKKNLGATMEDEPGYYFAWGETDTKDVFDASTYELKTGDDYTDIGSDISGTEYDAARAQWHGDWRMPTESECNELISNCSWSYVTINGHPCYKAKCRYSDSYVLFPVAGLKNGTTVSNDNYWAFYWTSNNDGTINARRTNFFGQNSQNMHSDNRAYGLLIKPIID